MTKTNSFAEWCQQKDSVSAKISDMYLVGLTELTWLYLRDNQISDVEPLAALCKLTELNLQKISN